MAEHANTSGLLYYAPIEGNQSYDHMLPSSSGKLHGIELLDPAVGMVPAFAVPTAERKPHSSSTDGESWHPHNSGT
ncbi:MAG TPA: hypothetical protein VIZ87_03515 [Terrimicrobium sp.]